MVLMKYRRLGRTNLKVSIIGQGGGVFTDPRCSHEDVKKILRHAVSKGVNIVDTAENYDETKIGYALNNEKKKVHIFTKSCASQKREMEKAIKQSLVKFKRNKIDIYGMHNVSTNKELECRLKGALPALKEARSKGLIDFIGISGHRIEVLIRAIKTNEFDVILVPYNLGHTLAEKLFPLAKEYDVGITIMKPLGGGFLVNPRIHGEKPYEGAEELTAENALKFIISNKQISSIFVGMREIDQVDEDTKIGDTDPNIPEVERKRLSERVRAFLGDDYCRSCKYCQPCEVNGWDLDIDQILRWEGFYIKYGYKEFTKKEYARLKLKADACIGCGKCIPKCPYNIQIAKRLKRAHRILSGKEDLPTKIGSFLRKSKLLWKIKRPTR